MLHCPAFRSADAPLPWTWPCPSPARSTLRFTARLNGGDGSGSKPSKPTLTKFLTFDMSTTQRPAARSLSYGSQPKPNCVAAPVVVGRPVTVTRVPASNSPMMHRSFVQVRRTPSASIVPDPPTSASSHTGENCATIHSSSAAVFTVHDASVVHSGRLQPRNSEVTGGFGRGSPPGSGRRHGLRGGSERERGPGRDRQRAPAGGVQLVRAGKRSVGAGDPDVPVAAQRDDDRARARGCPRGRAPGRQGRARDRDQGEREQREREDPGSPESRSSFPRRVRHPSPRSCPPG